jgi:hypothetical protein
MDIGKEKLKPREKFIMPRKAQSVTDALELIKPLVNVPITNDKLGITACITGRSKKKMGSEKATRKSVSPELHAMAVANIDVLYKNAEFEIIHPDYKNNSWVKQIHRLGALMFDEENMEYVPVVITVKEILGSNQNTIYTIEAIDINKGLNPAGRSTLGSHDGSLFVPITEFNTKMQQLLNDAIHTI